MKPGHPQTQRFQIGDREVARKLGGTQMEQEKQVFEFSFWRLRIVARGIYAILAAAAISATIVVLVFN